MHGGDLWGPRMGPQEPNWLPQPTKESSATLEVAGWTHQKRGYPNTLPYAVQESGRSKNPQVEEHSQPFSGQDKIADMTAAYRMVGG